MVFDSYGNYINATSGLARPFEATQSRQQPQAGGKSLNRMERSIERRFLVSAPMEM